MVYVKIKIQAAWLKYSFEIKLQRTMQAFCANVNLFSKPMVVQMFMIFLPHHRNRRIYMVPTDFFENAWIVKQTAPLHNDENAMFSH